MAESFDEDRSSHWLPWRPVAQLAERRSPKPQVGGSIPSWPAIYMAWVFYKCKCDAQTRNNL